MGLLIILVALGFADGNGQWQSQAAQEAFEVDGILASRVDADMEIRLGMLALQTFELLAQGLIAGLSLHDRDGLSRRLAIRSEEGNAMAVTRGINADADTVEGTRGRRGHSSHGSTPQEDKRWEATKDEASDRDGARELPPANLWRGDPCDERSSRMMYQSLLPKHGGNNLFKEVKASGTFKVSSRRCHNYLWLEMNIQGDIHCARKAWERGKRCKDYF